MVNYKKDKKSFIGGNHFHYNYTDEGTEAGNQWHRNFMPGFNAVYGYNMVDVSHYSDSSKQPLNLFETPVLVKTVYYPSNKLDTIKGKQVLRDYYMCSAFNEDTNDDGCINVKNLRRFFHFSLDGKHRTPLVADNYSVMKSEYDHANDYMYFFLLNWTKMKMVKWMKKSPFTLFGLT